MTNKILQEIFLDWYNNYLTVEVFAEHNGLTIKEATDLICLSRSIHERLVTRYNESAIPADPEHPYLDNANLRGAKSEYSNWIESESDNG